LIFAVYSASIFGAALCFCGVGADADTTMAEPAAIAATAAAAASADNRLRLNMNNIVTSMGTTKSALWGCDRRVIAQHGRQRYSTGQSRPVGMEESPTADMPAGG